MSKGRRKIVFHKDGLIIGVRSLNLSRLVPANYGMIDDGGIASSPTPGISDWSPPRSRVNVSPDSLSLHRL